MTLEAAAKSLGGGDAGGDGKAPCKGPRSSPSKNRKSKQQIKQSKLNPGWYIRSRLLDAGIELVEITKSNLTSDAFLQPLLEALRDGDDDLPINSIGIHGSVYMCIGLDNDLPLLNSNNSYTRQGIIRVLDEDETTPQRRLEAMRVIKTFLESTENNRYGTRVFIQNPGWDLTPPLPSPLLKMDSFVQYKEIVRVIQDLFDGVGGNWAASNMADAAGFFTEGHIPFAAHADLGFPLDAVVPNEPGLNGAN